MGRGKVDYLAAAGLKLRWFKKTFENFEKNIHGSSQSQFDAFARAESYWLEDYSLFSAIQGKEGTADWTRWTPRSANATARRHTSSAENLGPRHTLSSVCPVAIFRAMERVKDLLHF